MEGLQRSESTFRRQGSSGLIWDDKFLQRALNQVEAEKQAEAAAAAQGGGSDAPAAASANDGGAAGGRGYKPVKVAPPMMDPPSPKAGCCGVFGKPAAASKRPRSNKRRSK
ncbi:MAPK kinase substrate protein At1g80180-like [Argentina anserina]|uniref:MAPK kinase substrate protein At1g80180-like n=1 Tax=Argentina anserina TaxID=57926 RepID=UPI0021765FEA|nr:MAPK kinase substrate protein At1g80180-like [Potentilla anserina]